MPSPFPGMDPWLESPGVFPDVHDALIFLLREALNASLPNGYRARGATRIWMEEDRQRMPDVSVTSRTDWERPANGGVAVEAYTRVGMLDVEADFLPEPLEEQYLEIRTIAGDRLITAIEILSLANKAPGDAGRGAYRQKQSEYRTNQINLVEIDMLRGGQHTTSPLEGTTGPVSINLQPLLDRAYDTGRYDDSTYSTLRTVPPLTPEQQTWAESILREKGLLK